MPTQICSRCQTDTETVVDHKAGHELCSRCGLVLVINLFDEIPDSVEYGDETKNPVSEIENCSSFNSNDQKTAKNQSKKGFEQIKVMADGLGLTKEIQDRACDIYGEVDIMKTCRGRSISSIAAACLFIACKEIGSSRTLNEISAVADGVSKKNINRTAEAIKKQLEVESWILQPGEFIRRLCSKLGLKNRAIKAVQEAVERAQHLDIRRSPKSVLAAIIYMVIQLCQQDPVPVKDIAMVMEVTEVTIKKSFKDISVYATRVIPEWYAGEEDINKIPSP
ncbi:transcription factor IIB 2 [Hibiscus trionum]|uniref:Transcription factor IIB 2 n=1 Tax=Hibiscus trionum TaxID=183268 RepID=A0A9W7LKT5_HIBTR|nr:transcription factor IIB 2 [Hibiscus trionum]